MVGMFPPRRHFSMVIVLLLYPVVCLAGGIPEPLDSKVHVLSYDNYYRFIERHPLVLMEFYAPWCKHCQELESKLLWLDYKMTKGSATKKRKNTKEDGDFLLLLFIVDDGGAQLWNKQTEEKNENSRIFL